MQARQVRFQVPLNTPPDPTPGARLVLHGWFTEPEPHYEGGLGEEEVSAGLQASLGSIGEAMPEPPVVGLLSVRLHVRPSGDVERVESLADTLVADPALALTLTP